MGRHIAVIKTSTREVVHKVDIEGKSERQIERIDDGLNINLNHDEYHTQIVTPEQKIKDVRSKMNASFQK